MLNRTHTRHLIAHKLALARLGPSSYERLSGSYGPEAGDVQVHASLPRTVRIRNDELGSTTGAARGVLYDQCTMM